MNKRIPKTHSFAGKPGGQLGYDRHGDVRTSYCTVGMEYCTTTQGKKPAPYLSSKGLHVRETSTRVARLESQRGIICGYADKGDEARSTIP